MTDEEKKAIEYWRNETDWANWVKPCDMSYIVTLLDLIEKQQKEICRLQNIKRKDIQDLINNENENIYKNYISKDKIRAKIKELEEKPWLFNNDATLLKILKELLEEG